MQPQQKYFLGSHLERKLRFKVESASFFNPDIVFFALRSYKFRGRDSFLSELNRLQPRVYLYPHGPFISNGQEVIPLFGDNDVDEQRPIPGYCRYWYSCKYESTVDNYPLISDQFSWVGYPGLDNEWFGYLDSCNYLSDLKRDNGSGSVENEVRVLFLIRKFEKIIPGHEQCYGVLEYDEFLDIINEVFEVLSSCGREIKLVIKPHPANDFKGLANILNSYSNWEISSEPVYPEMTRSDIILGVPSTSLLMPLLYGKPVLVINCSALEQFESEWDFMYDFFRGFDLFVSDLSKLKALFDEALSRMDNAHNIEEYDEQIFFREIYPDGSLRQCLMDLGF